MDTYSLRPPDGKPISVVISGPQTKRILLLMKRYTGRIILRDLDVAQDMVALGYDPVFYRGGSTTFRATEDRMIPIHVDADLTELVHENALQSVEFRQTWGAKIFICGLLQRTTPLKYLKISSDNYDYNGATDNLFDRNNRPMGEYFIYQTKGRKVAHIVNIFGMFYEWNEDIRSYTFSYENKFL